MKSKQSISVQDFSALKILQQEAGNDVVKGIVLYQGILPFGKNLYAMPLNTLWELAS